MLNALSRLEVIREKNRGSAIAPQAEYRLRREAMLSMVHHSTAIEGNTLTPFEVEKVLNGGNISAPEREIHEVKNYKKALDYVARQRKTLIRPRYILKLHDLVSRHILPPEKSGQYRKEPVYVVQRTLISTEVRYTAPPHEQVTSLVHDLSEWIHQSRKQNLSPILIAGMAHAEIAAIHPFIDGNGRTARLLATLILYTSGYDFRKLFALENYYNSDRPEYYRAIHLGKNYKERQNADHTPWLEYFVQGFLTEMEMVMDRIAPFQYLKNTSKQIILSPHELKMLDYLQAFRHATSKELQTLFTVNRRTVQRYLASLVKKKLIIKKGAKKNAVYQMVA